MADVAYVLFAALRPVANSFKIRGSIEFIWESFIDRVHRTYPSALNELANRFYEIAVPADRRPTA